MVLGGGAAKSLDGDSSKSSWDNSASMLEEETKSKTVRASWEVSRKSYVRKIGVSEYGSREGRTGRGALVRDRQNDYRGRDRRLGEADTEKNYVRKSGPFEHGGKESSWKGKCGKGLSK
ncbi:hypothetical protein ACFX2I_026372 [Malus domestica]